MSEKIEFSYGCVEFYQAGDFVDIYDIELKSEYRGKGCGMKLMEQFLIEMKNRGVTDITLEVRIDNVVAIKLYEKFGFKHVSIRKRYYKGIDGLLMRLKF